MDLVNNPELLQRMHKLADVGDDPRHTLDMFLTGILGVELVPTTRELFTPHLEATIEQQAQVIKARLGWGTVNPAVVTYPHKAELTGGVLRLPYFLKPYTHVLATRELRQGGERVPTTEVAIGAYSIPIAKFADGSRWAIYVMRPTSLPYIAGAIQGAATGQLIESDLQAKRPFHARLEDNCNRFANLDPDSIHKLTLLGFDGSKGYWNDSQVTFTFEAKPLDHAEPIVHNNFDGLASVAGGWHKLDMPRPHRAFRNFGPILDLGKPERKNHRVIGLPTTGLDTFFEIEGQRLMASYTPVQTARLLLEADRNPRVRGMLYSK